MRLRGLIDPLPAGDGKPSYSLQVWTTGVGSIGFGIASAALGYLSYALTHSLIVVLIVSTVRVVPSAVLVRPIGLLLGRMDTRHVLLIARGLTCALFVGAGFAPYRTSGDVIILIIVALAWGVLAAVSQPGAGRLIGVYVPKSRFDEATGATSSANGLGNVLGAAAGGLLLMHTSTTITFVVMGLLYLPSALSPLLLPRAPRAPMTQHGLGEPFSQSIQLMRGTPVLLAAVVCTVVLELFAWPVVALLPRMAAALSMSPAVFSALLSGYFLGNTFVYPVVRAVKRRTGYGALLHLTLVLLAVVVIVSAGVGFLPSVGPAVGALTGLMVLFGLLIGLATSVSMAAILFGAPAHSAPSVSAMYWAVVGGLGPVGALIFILVAQEWDVWWSLTACALLLLLVSIVLWRKGAFDRVSDINREALCPLCADTIRLRIPQLRLWTDPETLTAAPDLMAREMAVDNGPPGRGA